MTSRRGKLLAENPANGRPDDRSRRRSDAVAGAAAVITLLAAVFFVVHWLAGHEPHWGATATLPVLVVLVLYLVRRVLQAERGLRFLESRLQGITQNAKEYAWECDSQGRFVYLTKRAEQIFGFALEELFGRRFFEFMPEDEAVKMRGWLSGILTNPRSFSEVEFCTVHPYSGHRWHQFSGEPILDSAGRIEGYRGVGLDITDRKQVEQARREQLELLETLLDTIPSAIFYKDLQGRYLGCNQTLCKWLGRSREQILGLNDYELYPTDLAEIYGKVERRLMHKAGRERFEAEFAGAGGSRKNALFHTATFRDAQGDIRGLVSVVADISDLKRFEKDLLAAKEQAEAASRAKDEFIANMSHEIRTPLTAILGFADVLLENLKESDNLHAAKTIKRNCLHLQEIIDDILDLSEIQAGKLTVQLVPCSPRRIMADIVSLMSVRAESRGLPLLVRQEGPLPEVVTTDPVRLRQILVNLVGNAIKFTESGQVEVLVSYIADDAENGTLPQLRFDVIDTGIGMSDEQIEQAFQPFTQADSSSTRPYSGTGLGLLLSRRLARMLNGDVTISSSLGRGCVASLTIDAGARENVRMIDAGTSVDEKPLPPDDNDAQHGAWPRLDCRVLLVEDGPDNQRLICYILEKAGAEVSVARNGFECLQMALPELGRRGDDAQKNAAPAAETSRREPFDIILMDMQMPIMDGKQATQRLRQADYKGPIIAISAHTVPENVENCLECGCDDFIPKPVDRARLLKTVAHQLAASRCAVRHF